MSELVECHHDVVTRLAPLYVDGRPLYRCDECGVRFTYADDEPSHKALAVYTQADNTPPYNAASVSGGS